MRVGEAEINVVADGDEFNRQMARIIEQTRQRWRAASASMAADTKLWRDENGRLHDEFGRFVAETNRGFLGMEISARGFTRALGAVVGGLARFTLASTAIGSLVGVLGAVTASAIQFTAALAPAVGIVATAPAAFGLAAAAVATLVVAVSGVGEAFGAAVSGDAEEFAEAIEGIAPSAQRAAQALRDITPEFSALKASVQDAFFVGFDDVLRSIAATLVGPLTSGMTAAAAGLSGIVTRLGEAATSGAGIAFVENTFAHLANTLENLREPLGLLFEGFFSLGSAISIAFGGDEAGAALGAMITRFADFINTAADSGAAVEWVRSAGEVFRQLGDILSPLIGIIGTIGSVAQDTGGNILGAFGSALQSVNAFLSSAEGVSALTTIFQSLNQVGGIFGDMLAGLLPIIAPLVGELVTGLMPVLQSISPVLIQIASLAAPIFSQILAAVLPLVPPLLSIAQLALPLLAQLLTQVVAAAAPLLEALTTLLVSILTPLLPALEPLITIFGELAVTIAEILTPVIQLVGDILLWLVDQIIVPFVIPIIEFLAELFADQLTAALELAAAIFQGIAEGIAAAATWLWDQVSSRWEAMKLGFQLLGSAFQSGYNFIKNNVFTPLGTAANSVKNTLSGIWTNIKNAFQTVVDKFKTGKTTITTALNGIWSGVKGAYNALASGWNRIDIAIGPFSIPDWVPGVGGRTFHIPDIIPDIPKLREGGLNLAEGIRWLHPHEAVVPLDGDRGINALADALARASSMTAGVGLGGRFEVRVFIGDTELTDIIDVRIEEHDDDLAHQARTGSGRR